MHVGLFYCKVSEKYSVFIDMTSTELKDALNRRLRKLEPTGSAQVDVSMNNSSVISDEQNEPTCKSPDDKEVTQLYRSGWSAPAPIPRSTVLPTPPSVLPAALKSDIVPKKVCLPSSHTIIPQPSPHEINTGVVDQRLKDISERRSSGSNTSGSRTPVPPPRHGSTDSVLMEGYLSKFSSGALTSRWQKRYFVLRESGLEYFGKESHARARIPGTSVVFATNRLKSVSSGPSNREFELVIGKRRRKYCIKASTPDLTSQWMKLIKDLISSHHSSRLSDDASDDSVASSGEDHSGTLGSCSLNDNSSLGDRTAAPVETVWEQPEITPEELDALFSEWFVFLEDPNGDVKSGRIIDAGSRAVSDLWAVLGRLPRGEDVVFEEVKSKITERSGIEPVCAEYVMRLSSRILFWLTRRRVSNEDIPVVLEWILRFKRNISFLVPKEADEEGGSPTHSERGTILAPPAKWYKALSQLVQRLAAEWEVCLIELVNHRMPSEGVWDLPPVVSLIGKLTRPHGPAQLPVMCLGAPRNAVLTTSWTLEYLDGLDERCLSRKTARGTPWTVAYPSCAHELTRHAASALVASLNSCWREMKRRATQLAAYKSSAVGSMMNRVKRFTVTSPSRNHAKICRDMLNMLAFGNETTLLSVFCQHASAFSVFSSPVFTACMEGLSCNFAAIASEVSKTLVKMHFLKAQHKVIMGAFDPKQLAVRVKVPIFEILQAARSFIDSLAGMGCHDLFKYLVVGQVMQGVGNAYITSLVRHRPKISKFTRLAAVVAEDEGLFFSMFRELGRPATEINSAIDQISHTRIVLTETNLAPPTRGGLPLVQECVELTKAFSSSQKAIEVVKALLEMKGVPKADRRDIVYSVSECVQKNIASPSPGMLDLSREEDEEFHDGSGISSRSGHTNDDSSN